MSNVSRPYQLELIKALRDPTEAIAYLSAALEDGSEEILMMALKNVATAQGVEELPMVPPGEQAHDLSDRGPRLATLSNLLKILGFRLSVEARGVASA
jgi:DNA-binding phage protein